MINLQEVTVYLISKQLFSHIDSIEYVKWAVLVLENGYDNESLRILAGLDNSDTEERLKYFQKSLDELSIQITTDKNELLNNFTKLLAKKVIEGSEKPSEGLRIMVDIVSASNYSSKFIQFMDLNEDIDYVNYSGSPLFNATLRRDNIDEIIINEFRLFLEVDMISLNVRELAFCKKCNNSMKPILKKKFSIIKSNRYNYYCCSICGSKDLVHGNTQEGVELILNTINKYN